MGNFIISAPGYRKEHCWKFPGLGRLSLWQRYIIMILSDGTLQQLVYCCKINRTTLYEVKLVLEIHVYVFLYIFIGTKESGRNWVWLPEVLNTAPFEIVTTVQGLRLFRYYHKHFGIGYFIPMYVVFGKYPVPVSSGLPTVLTEAAVV